MYIFTHVYTQYIQRYVYKSYVYMHMYIYTYVYIHTLQHVLQHTATRCNTLQHAATQYIQRYVYIHICVYTHVHIIHMLSCVVVIRRMAHKAHTVMCKLYVSCAEYRLFYRALLQKRPIFLRSLPVE